MNLNPKWFPSGLFIFSKTKLWIHHSKWISLQLSNETNETKSKSLKCKMCRLVCDTAVRRWCLKWVSVYRTQPAAKLYPGDKLKRGIRQGCRWVHVSIHRPAFLQDKSKSLFDTVKEEYKFYKLKPDLTSLRGWMVWMSCGVRGGGF